MIKAVFFDAIDTLFCAYPDKIRMYQKIIKEKAGIDVSFEQMASVWNEVFAETEREAKKEIHFHKKQLAWQGFNQRMLKKLNFEGDLNKKGEELRIESWSNPENFILYDDVKETLKELKNQGILISCVSNESVGLYNFFTHFGIRHYFDDIVISEIVKYEKPAPEIFTQALSKFNLQPKEVLFVGDSLISDYEGAKNVGMNAVVIDRDKLILDNRIAKIDKLTDILMILQKGEKNACTNS